MTLKKLRVSTQPKVMNSYETSHLNWYVYACKSITNLNVDDNLNQDENLTYRKLFRRLIVKVIIKYGLLYYFVEYERITIYERLIVGILQMWKMNT